MTSSSTYREDIDARVWARLEEFRMDEFLSNVDGEILVFPIKMFQNYIKELLTQPDRIYTYESEDQSLSFFQIPSKSVLQ